MRMRVVFYLAALLVVATGGCLDQPLEPANDQGAATIDSTEWRARMAHWGGPYLAGAMTECGSGACSFTPADFICGADKIGCTAQTSQVDVEWIVTNGRKTVNVSGRGALLCNATMGTVIAFDVDGDPVATQDMVPISPSDCGSDNITFGGQATVSYDGGIDHIVITPMSPFTFPVQGGGTGIADETYTVTYNDDAVPFTLACTATVVRAATANCAATPTGAGGTATITSWKFINSVDGTVVERDAGAAANLTWSGQLVAAGHTEITASVNGVVFGLPMASNPMVVTPRDWSQVSLDSQFTINVPSGLTATPTTFIGGLGLTDHVLYSVSPLPVQFLNDGGPNQGYYYFTAPPFIPGDSVRINEAMATGTSFYNLQYPTDTRVNLGGGKKVWYCGRNRVLQLKPLIEAHEGTQWATEPNSHAAIYFHTVFPLIRTETEAAVGPNLDPTALSFSIESRGAAPSHAMETDPILNTLKWDADSQFIFSTSLRCKFKFF